MDLGDRTVGDVLTFTFPSYDLATGPIVFAGTPAVACFKNGGTTPITAGVSLTVSLGAVVGKNLVTIDTEAFDDNADYRVEVTAGTVSGVSQVGRIVGYFSLSNRLDALIKEQTDLIESGSVTISNPYDSSTQAITLVRGDAYLAADGRAIDVTVSAGTGILPADITGSTVSLKLKFRSTTVSIAGSITTPTGSSKVFRFEITAAQTAVLTVGNVYKWEIEVLIGGSATHAVTLLSGSSLTVVPDL